MRIDEVKVNKKHYLNLLLLGDEQESMIDKYLERSKTYVMVDNSENAIAVAVVTHEGNGVLELKNLVVSPSCQRKGYGRKMIEFLCEHYKDLYHTLQAGTGDSKQTMSFYNNCHFTYSHTVPDFFVTNYDHLIIEEGKILRDMIYFKKNI